MRQARTDLDAARSGAGQRLPSSTGSSYRAQYLGRFVQGGLGGEKGRGGHLREPLWEELQWSSPFQTSRTPTPTWMPRDFLCQFLPPFLPSCVKAVAWNRIMGLLDHSVLVYSEDWLRSCVYPTADLHQYPISFQVLSIWSPEGLLRLADQPLGSGQVDVHLNLRIHQHNWMDGSPAVPQNPAVSE